MQNEIFYLVDWNNGFVGGFNEKYQQIFNTPKEMVFDDIISHELLGRILQVITSEELDALRGYHAPTLELFLETNKNIGDKGEKMEYYITYKIEARYTVKCEAQTIDEAKKEAANHFFDADFGEAYDIDGELIIIEDDNDNIIYENLKEELT